ncbi:ABC transporter ATP-binding protein [Vallitalea pronyensis]|uniref:ABC transporter ATP-binding protein n=1 Tax=Vallitalea pronyensis TaxID=1348613 RepID=A0A8J8MND8_9FIRM|nr:ABC transporter ATP-binding protein [Vallitalea pronyensis]QUI24607.1 ABC transporter ATP-binding protein [Vallitalea pronyensis]
MIKLFKGIKPYKIAVIVILIFTFMQTFTELFLPTIMAKIVDVGIVNEDMAYILRMGAIMLAVAGIGGACSVYSRYLSSKVANGFGRNLRQQVFQKVEGYSLQEFDHMGTSSLITRTTNDITQVQNVLVMLLRIFVMAPIMAIGGIIMAITRNPNLSVTLVGVIVVLAIVIGILASKSLPLFKSIQKKLDRLNLVLRERLTGIRVIRAFNKTTYEKSRFQKANQDLTDTTKRVNKMMALLQPLLTLLFSLTTIVIVWAGAFKVNEGSMLVGDLMAYIQYVSLIMFALIMLTMVFIMVPRASASATRIQEVLSMETPIKDPVNPQNTHTKKGYVTFDHVTFGFQGAEGHALQDISFQAKPGEVTAIIGGTGSGKSTLIHLLARFYDATQGAIMVDGMDIRHMTQKALREKIGLVPQKAVLFSGTIAENIRFGSENASDEDIKHAATIAQATEFIEQMDDGYDAVIAQGGTNLSGGQKQRLSIARALVKKPEIYIFDDSFSALDFKTDAKLRKALKQEVTEGTVLIVAQRVTTVMDADRIIVLDDGVMVGMGTHEELLSSCEVYEQIVRSQLSEEELA